MPMKKHYLLLMAGFIIALHSLQAQDSRFVVHLSDKDTANNPYSLEAPGEFLSQKALDRRSRFGIEPDMSDLPLSPRYTDSISRLVSRIQNRSRWFNLLVVEAPDSVAPFIKNKPFVDSLARVAPAPSAGKKNTQQPAQNTQAHHYAAITSTLDSSAYGYTWRQIQMLKGHHLHQGGYQGRGLTIAIMDAGFQNADKLPAFDSLRTNNQIKSTADFEDHDGNVYESDRHGTMVLSVIAANIPGVYRGTAPKADFILLRTEVTGSEYISEEYNWIAAAEYADSAGTNIINSSLGYSTFNDSTQDHTYQDLDGNTTPITRAADMAAAKGMLVVSSAGNLGNDSWRYISAPADADSIITVGAVDERGNHASFSSVGPTADGRIKPEVAAQGVATAVASPDSSLLYGNGTSFSAPIITGLMACLWEKYPNLNNMQLRDKLIRNASQWDNPDSLTGYGIPNFSMAGNLGFETLAPKAVRSYPNPFRKHFILSLPTINLKDQTLSIDIYDIMGKKRFTQQFTNTLPPQVRIDALHDAPPGIYLVKISLNHELVTKEKIIKE